MEKEYFSLLYTAIQEYRSHCATAIGEYHLPPNAFVILCLLSDHPELDKAADIAKRCGVSTSLVSRSIERLVCLGILETIRDEKDRRVIHLRIREECKGIEKVIKEANRRFYIQLTAGISENDLSVFFDVFCRMIENLKEKDKKGVDVKWKGKAQGKNL